jgi:hypothetical protein
LIAVPVAGFVILPAGTVGRDTGDGVVRLIEITPVITDDLAEGIIHVSVVSALRGGALPPGTAAVTVKAVLELFESCGHGRKGQSDMFFANFNPC